MQTVNIFWFRRDLRLDDNAGLTNALKSEFPVMPVFIFDKHILSKLPHKKDRRVEFIHDALTNIEHELKKIGSSLHVFYGKPEDVYKELMEKHRINAIYTNHDYEPYAIDRDKKIAELLKRTDKKFYSFKDQVIFEKEEVVKDDGKPYTVFTPYSRKWKTALKSTSFESYPTRKYFSNFFKNEKGTIPSLKEIGFEKSDIAFPANQVDEELVRHYAAKRDIPSVAGTSKLGVHLRFGTISIRKLAAKAQSLSETFLNELIWRDFYHMILWHFPHVGKGKSFKPAYEHIQWRHDNGEFDKWCKGQTGYPIVDAGMRELNATGFMHNRVRMIVASFLCKHLLLDWRLGEAYFAEKLLDFDFAANNGGWQWAAGSGCDAAPYFRIFNPYLQTKKFDPDLHYIKKWVPEFQELTYPTPIVEHEKARKRCLEVYAAALKS